MVATLEKINLLIVDDNEDLRSTLCDFFAEQGARIFSASNGRKAMQIATTEKIDLILSDVEMPEMDGIEFLKYIKNYSDDAPLFWLMSGKSDLFEETVCSFGAEGLFRKPFKLKLVLEKITQSLKKRPSLDDLTL